MPETLREQDKERLIRMVFLLLREIRENTPSDTIPQTMRMVAPVLAHLKRRSLIDTLHLLDYSHASSASQPHWAAMSRHVKPILSEIASAYSDERQQKEAALYSLGWLHRLSRIASAETYRRPANRSRKEEAQGHSRREESLTSPALPPEEPFQYSPIAEAFGHLKQQDSATRPETAPLVSEAGEPISSQEEVEEDEVPTRPVSGKHRLWVTALPGAKPRIITEWGERIPCFSLLNFNIPDSAKFLQEDGTEGLMCLAEVSYKNSTALSARFLRWLTDTDNED